MRSSYDVRRRKRRGAQHNLHHLQRRLFKGNLARPRGLRRLDQLAHWSSSSVSGVSQVMTSCVMVWPLRAFISPYCSTASCVVAFERSWTATPEGNLTPASGRTPCSKRFLASSPFGEALGILSVKADIESVDDRSMVAGPAGVRSRVRLDHLHNS